MLKLEKELTPEQIARLKKFYDHFVQKLTGNLGQMSNKQKSNVPIGGKMYSVQELIDNINSVGEVGADFLRKWVDANFRLLEIKRKSGWRNWFKRIFKR